MIRIALDLRLNSYRVGGIPQYSNQLLTALALAASDEERFVAIQHRKPMLGPSVYGSRVTTRRVWTPPHHRWEQLVLPLELANVRADVFHFPDFIPLFRLRRPAVITVHDLAFVRYPEILDTAAKRYYGQINRAVKHAAAIIAVSQSTASDLLTLTDADPGKIEVVSEAAAVHFQPLTLHANAAQTINGQRLHPGTFALFVGTIEPRKNLVTLLQALRQLLDRGDVEQPLLVVAGARGWLDEDVFTTVRQLRLESAVQFIGSVDQRALVWLYNACHVYLHPELYSGFGLPVLEAMQCGAPTIVADTSSLPEVAANAALLLPPLDVRAWADAWANVWENQALRDQLRHRGLQRAAQFTWEQAARDTLRIYRRVAGKAT